MKSSCPWRTATQFALVLACAAAFADEAPGKAGDDAVEVTATRNPVDKSYRRMLRGMDLFQEMRALAPNAVLRYKLLPRRHDTNMDGIVLEIVGDTERIAVPLAPDRTFTLERHQQALEEAASVMPNRKAGSLTWRTDIRTPGLPPDTRRLGDLRLECHVGMEADLVSNTRAVAGLVPNAMLRAMGFCNSSTGLYYFFAERALFSVTMVAGARREVLPSSALYAGTIQEPMSDSDLQYCDCQVLLDRTYALPLGDRSWPDDTLVEFEYMEDAGAPRS